MGRSAAVWMASVIAAFTSLTLLAAEPSSEQKAYDVKEAGFSVSAPASWEQLKPARPRLGLVLRSNPPKAGEPIPTLVDIAVIPLKNNSPADEQLAEVVEGMRQRASDEVGPSGKVGDNQEIKLDGVAATQFTYPKKTGGRDTTAIRTVTIHGGKVYIIAATVDAAQDETASAAVKKVLESWKWTEQAK